MGARAMLTCLITITYLGQRRQLLRAASDTGAAIVWALGVFPQACRISARAIGPATVTEAHHAQL